jgi:deglycase
MSTSKKHPKKREQDIDQALDDTFPASDPPAWNLGREAADGAGKSMALDGKVFAILATNGFEQSELLEPKKALEDAGARTEVISPKPGAIRGWTHQEWGDEVTVDVVLDAAKPDHYDGLVLPGGVMNPDHLRMEPRAVDFVRAMYDGHKPIAAICHGPWLLIEAGLAKGAKLTSWPSLCTDIRNAGGDWVDGEVVADGQLVTSRKPADLPHFNCKMIEVFARSRGTQSKVRVAPPDVS